VENVRAYLEQAASLAPGDDRVWLGRANLAIRTGAYDEAERLLDDCLKRRPEDIPVWRARLNWGLATNRLDTVQQAMTYLPATESSPAQVHRLKAWFASKQSDVVTERRELEYLLSEDPADLKTIDRLAQLTERAGQPDQSAALLRKKAEIVELRARYEKLFDRNQPIRDAEEMASLAKQLGRNFEARVFITVAISEEPEREDLQQNLRQLPSQNSKPGTVRGRTLAEVVADEPDDMKVGALKK
jgi:predicted Zn-dependent protease